MVRAEEILFLCTLHEGEKNVARGFSLASATLKGRATSQVSSLVYAHSTMWSYSPVCRPRPVSRQQVKHTLTKFSGKET